ncbi:MAG: serine/threonine protein kinase [Gallionella sp.]|nr:serine/threonine protein kinase [Gallionella sp.]
MINHLGRYEVVGELGQGAMGIVYKAIDPLIDRVVAIKTINLGLALDEKEEYEGRFYQEAKAAGRLNHQNIVTIYDVGKSGDVAYIAMEFLQGRELRDIMNDAGVLPVGQALDIAAQVAQGLSYAHEHEIVHRDIKPSNIMVVRDGHVKITDFGIARMASSSVRTQTGMVLGSPKYMSPEQVMGKALDQRSDIFSLGVMLYEMLTGHPPFDGENVNAIMYQTVNTVPASPSTLNHVVPEMANFIVAKALSKGLDDRYQNARDFAVDLRACRDTLPHSSQKVDLLNYSAANKGKLPDAISVPRHTIADEDENNPANLIGLSPAFDSAAATMRLAALTAVKEDVDELSKSLKIPIQDIESIGRAASAVKATSPVTSTVPLGADKSHDEPLPQSKGGNLLLVIVVVIILLGIVLALVF